MKSFPKRISGEHLEQLSRAKSLLERPSLAARLTDALGAPIEKGFKLLPERWSDTIQQVIHNSLNQALEVAIRSLEMNPGRQAGKRFHKIAIVATGAAGGAFGLGGLVVELPVSTILILRAIADIARSEGERIRSPEAQLACLEVFALGGAARSADAAETGYFAVRSALAKMISEAAGVMEIGLTGKGAPALVRFLGAVASRFGLTVSEKAAAMALPAIGAAGGALINSLFIDHFQDVARGHFIVRRLERTYGRELVRSEYQQLASR